jgi:hypothetical protein
MTLAKQRMSISHRLDAPIKGLDQFIRRATAFEGVFCNHGHTREDILDAMVKLGDQLPLMFLVALASR